MKIIATAMLLAACLVAGPVQADEALAKAKNCMGCHAVDKKLVGPSYKDIAAKYKADKGAVDKLAHNITAGSKGSWGDAVMPPNPTVSADEAKKLATWVLSLK